MDKHIHVHQIRHPISNVCGHMYSVAPTKHLTLCHVASFSLQLFQIVYGHGFFVASTKHPTPSDIASLSSSKLDAIKVVLVFDLCLQVYTTDVPYSL
jgi:hypothetical protein